MPTIFSRIVQGEIPSYKVAESDRFYAFLDIRPIAQGHTLVIPKKEVDYIFDLEPEELSALFAFAQKVAQGIKSAIPCKKVAVAVLGMEVPHAHIHLVPLNTEGDLDFKRAKLSLSEEQMRQIAKDISGSIV